MKYFITLSCSLLICFSTCSAFAQKSHSKTPVKAKVVQNKEAGSYWAGIIQKQGVTTYQYGTYVLKGKPLSGNPDEKESIFALRSKKIKLNKFIGKKVIVTGKKIAGYPIEGGPDFIEVLAIELDKVVKIN